MEHQERIQLKEFFMIIGGIFLGVGSIELLSIIPFTKLDKIVLFLGIGILFIIIGYDILNRKRRQIIKNLILIGSTLIIMSLIRIYL